MVHGKDYFLMKWYEKEKEKRQNALNHEQIMRINQQLQSILLRLQVNIDQQQYEDVIHKFSYSIVQSSIWNLKYRNNFENPEVALAQAVLIQTIIMRENMNSQRYIKQVVDNLMIQLSHVSPLIYQDYRRELQILQQ